MCTERDNDRGSVREVRHVKLLMMCVVAVFAFAIPAASASAAKTKDVVQLNEGTTKAANEAPASLAMLIDTCIVRSHGHLTGNNLPTVTEVTTASESEGCGEHISISGSISKSTVSTKKAFTLTGTLTVTSKEGEATGPCKYAYSKWKLKIPAFPGPVLVEAKVTGKLVTTGSNKDCLTKKTETQEVLVALEDEEGPFNAELVG
jgi:hypothetical protein